MADAKLAAIESRKRGLLGALHFTLGNTQQALLLSNEATLFATKQIELQNNFILLGSYLSIEWPTLIHYITGTQDMLDLDLAILQALRTKYLYVECQKNLYEHIQSNEIINDIYPNIQLINNMPSINIQTAPQPQTLQQQPNISSEPNIEGDLSIFDNISDVSELLQILGDYNVTQYTNSP